METELLGRQEVLAKLEALVLERQTVLLYGPVGIGKTTVLAELKQRVERQGLPCGLASRTERLQDVTQALQRVFPDAALGARTQRSIRGSVRSQVNNPVAFCCSITSSRLGRP